MVVGAKVCDLTEDLLWFVRGLYVGILTSSLRLLDLMLGEASSNTNLPQKSTLPSKRSHVGDHCRNYTKRTVPPLCLKNNTWHHQQMVQIAFCDLSNQFQK